MRMQTRSRTLLRRAPLEPGFEPVVVGPAAVDALKSNRNVRQFVLSLYDDLLLRR